MTKNTVHREMVIKTLAWEGNIDAKIGGKNTGYSVLWSLK